MKLISSLLAVLSFVPAIGNGVWFPVEAQNWSRHQENNFRNVVAIIKPRRGRNCQNHRIRADGRVYDAQKGTRGSYLIVDQVVLLTGITATDPQVYKIWQVFYEPSRTKMWIKDCDLSIPRLVD
ncbi:MAG: hypothetical protein EHM73_14345 [Chroococcales cyanobacterium metabat2.561]|jgi:hypothetical protein|uniref:Uncharacterized protein n=1 Tax=Microcystis aeruginosa Ma_SC_T_19800800_S464 TaxID=2486257 RepID=A0A552DSP5_MICAE|nr:MAG: hypothetical protein EHM73_14345 [Chroococcales cyanobacterium metabat2.561]TRT85030.1 MAG: hypothetical protein EWV82_07580 [Microcystis aeruginosa Ma_AC_P_19900807_S299]TRU25186.1 MAG: hypothetical protein EWV81_12605 [Microcystis aeruginosa Ma_SC_T_19800800_S464]